MTTLNANTITLTQIEFSLSDLRSRYNQALGQLQMKQQERDQKQDELIKAKHDIEVWQQVQVLFSKVSEFARAQLIYRMEETVSAALQAVFMDESEFIINMRTLDGKPAAEWLMQNNKGVVVDPEDGDGGGAYDIVSAALRLSLLELSRPKPGGPVILDEPGKMLDNQTEVIPNTGQFLKHYLEKTKRQGLMITHHPALSDVAHLSYKAEKNADGMCEISEVIRYG